MAIISKPREKKTNANAKTPEKSIRMTRSKIDRDGTAWSRKVIWCRQEHLGKLKVISHFQGKPIQELIDTSIEEFISRIWDCTIARKKLVDGVKK